MKIKALLVFAMTSVAAVAYAGEKPDFAAVDADQDGTVSMDEAKAVKGLTEVFLDADANKDGKLDEAEYSEAGSK